jgi:hypothetical protein
MDAAILVSDKDTPGSIRYWVRHASVPVDYILESAQTAIYAQLRCREMITRVEGTIAEDATTITLPTGFLEPILLMLRGSYHSEVVFLDPEHFESRNPEDESNARYEGTPTEYTADGTTIYLNAKADQAYSYRLWYMGMPSLLIDPAQGNVQTNFLTERYPHLLEAYLKHYAWEDRQDSGKANENLQKALGFIGQANANYDMLKQQIRHEFYWSR